jgi:hypothetical protein
MGVTAIEPYGVTGENLDIQLRQNVTFTVVRKEYRFTFLVCPLPTQADGLLGTNVWDEAGAVIDLDSNKVSLVSSSSEAGHERRFYRHRKRAALTVFPHKEKENRSPTRRKEHS